MADSAPTHPEECSGGALSSGANSAPTNTGCSGRCGVAGATCNYPGSSEASELCTRSMYIWKEHAHHSTALHIVSARKCLDGFPVVVAESLPALVTVCGRAPPRSSNAVTEGLHRNLLFAAPQPEMAAGGAKPPGTSSRILLDMPCKVCLDHSSGKHYGIFACDGCAGFFKRSIRRNRQYTCKARGAAANACPVDKTHRNQCRACRLRKCIESGMNREAVQHERGPRNSTLRRQVALYIKEGLRPPGLGSPITTAALTPAGAAGVLSAAGAAAAAAASVGGHLAVLHPALLGSAGVTHDTASSVAAAAAFYAAPSLRPTVAAGYAYEIPRGLPETICESAARLLFMNVQWMKVVTATSTIPMRDQVFLLEEGWREMFVLSAAQFHLPLDVAPLLAAAGISPEQSSSEHVEDLVSRIRNFQDVVAKLHEMGLDHSEYACMKAIALFKTNFPGKPSESLPLRSLEAVGAMQDQAHAYLMRFVQAMHPAHPERYGKIMLALAWLSTVPSETIEELFFRKAIGAIPIARLLGDMYKTGSL
ncbi:hypothetical protein HPB50_002662 [Hyalomma asiaticum]|uniref:Uncharacterized protein n=1 Tax=Hyalomma asiaticum TaxID=266040 RepID=A0ACB7RYU5_HYAAI|nr:hypothetical protein HPB50_002662 [Hyalomma asiaticum]